jgi:hypothetical protein
MEIRKSINPGHQNTLLISEITVPDNCKRIVIEKKIEASVEGMFMNKVDISLYDPEKKWRGRVDRYKKVLIIDGNSENTGNFVSGKWRLYYEVFQIYEPVEIILNIHFELYEAYNVYTGELHTHTVNTDGKLSLEAVSEYLKEKPCDFFFVSDHNSIAAWDDLKMLSGIKGYRGLELTTFSGHVLLLGLEHSVSWYHEDGTLKELCEIRKEVHSQGGVMGIAHPYANGGPFCAGCRWDGPIEPESIDFIEVWNSKGNNFKGNWEAIELWIEFLKADKKIFCTCGADLHSMGDLDTSLKVYVLSDRNDEKSVVAALKAGRFYLSGETEIQIDINGKTFGQTLRINDQTPENKFIPVNYDLKNKSHDLKFFIITKDGLQPLVIEEKLLEWRTEHQRDFLIVLAMTSDRQVALLTNPIFLERKAGDHINP